MVPYNVQDEDLSVRPKWCLGGPSLDRGPHLLFQVVIDRNHLVIGVRGQPSIIKVSYFHRAISGSFNFRAGTFI